MVAVAEGTPARTAEVTGSFICSGCVGEHAARAAVLPATALSYRPVCHCCCCWRWERWNLTNMCSPCCDCAPGSCPGMDGMCLSAYLTGPLATKVSSSSFMLLWWLVCGRWVRAAVVLAVLEGCAARSGCWPPEEAAGACTARTPGLRAESAADGMASEPMLSGQGNLL